MEIKDRIKEQRNKLGITQQQLAFDTGLSVDGIRSIESGRAKPNIDTLIKLSERFGCTTDYLLLGDGKEDTVVTDETGEIIFDYMTKFITRQREGLDTSDLEDHPFHYLDKDQRLAFVRDLVKITKTTPGEK